MLVPRTESQFNVQSLEGGLVPESERRSNALKSRFVLCRVRKYDFREKVVDGCAVKFRRCGSRKNFEPFGCKSPPGLDTQAAVTLSLVVFSAGLGGRNGFFHSSIS